MRAAVSRRSGIAAVVCAGALTAAGAQGASPPEAAPDPAGASTVTSAGPRYEAGRLHRLLFGDDYRDLWALPFHAEVLELERAAGGLTPVRKVGSGQSTGLALRGADGRAYTFRRIEKDATRGLSPELQRTVAGQIAQDQVAALHPAAAVVAAPLLDAAGVLHVTPRLVVMPDDPRLAEFRAEFAGLLGTIEEYPRPAREGDPGFAGATEIVSTDELAERIRVGGGDRVDARAYLRARLMDLFLGDWDRHTGQWRWARVPGVPGWQPIPEDRDFAFCRFEGAVLAMARNWFPRWVTFGERYPPMLGLTWQAWPLDRALLAELERPAWDELAADLQRRLADDVIDAAVRRLPEEYQREDGPRLAASLRGRRDRLREAADAFYRHLAEEVAIGATDAADVAEAVALDGGDLEVTVRRAGDPGAAAEDPWFRRRFRRGETREVRLDLRGGDDRFVARGRSAVRVRVVGGPGDDLLDDSAGGKTRLADAEGQNRVLRGRGTRLDTRPYLPPPLESKRPYLPARDWGRQRFFVPWFAADPDTGLFVGGGVRFERFGFRAHPYRYRHVLRAGYALGPSAFRFDYEGELRRESSRIFFTADARASQLEILHFYGFGNETPEPAREQFFEVQQTQLSFAPKIHLPIAGRLVASGGPAVQRSTTRLSQGSFIGLARPYGSEPFGQLGAAAELRLDTRDVPAFASRGLLLAGGGAFYPAVWSVRDPFGEVHASAAAHVTAPIPLRPALALRGEVKRVFGTYPFHEAAFVGGAASLRGFSSQRFAGDASALGTAELRLTLGRYFLILPGEYGVFALVDTARVWLEGERSRTWHTGYGGGLWFAYLRRAHTVTIAAVRSDEKTGFYLAMGFAF
jgi:hypothetical protein